MGLATCKVPAAIATGLICFALGAGAGMGGMVWYGYPLKKPDSEGAPQAPPDGSLMGMRPGGSGGGPPGGMMGMMGMMGGGRGPNSKNQLAQLVVKLDQVTGGTLTLNLTAGQKKKVQEQLQGLADQAEVGEEEAKEKLDALLEVLKDHKVTLEAAGYRWPGQGGRGMGGRGMGRGMAPPETPPNPFKEGANAKHLKSLQSQLAKPGSAEKPAS